MRLQNASEFQTWKSRPQLIHMQYAMLNEATGNSDAPRLAKWQSIVVRILTSLQSLLMAALKMIWLQPAHCGSERAMTFRLESSHAAFLHLICRKEMISKNVVCWLQMALQLSQEQKERLLAARTYLLAQMMEIIQERTLIISMLQVRILPFQCPFLHCHHLSHIGLAFLICFMTRSVSAGLKLWCTLPCLQFGLMYLRGLYRRWRRGVNRTRGI